MLSVVIPIYNERHNVARVIAMVAAALPAIPKQIIAVDDGSNDGTREWLKANVPGDFLSGSEISVDAAGNIVMQSAGGAPTLTLKALYHERNRGKGGALQTGLAATSGDVIVIQDADLEYDPGDWGTMYDLVAVRKVADVVYGSRFYGRPHRSLFFHHYLGNRLISLIYNVLYNQTLSDVEVCYKMFTRAVRESLRLTCEDFGCEIQLSAQIANPRKWRIYETPVHYFGRTYAEGKKINWRDGLKALWYLVIFRFVR